MTPPMILFFYDSRRDLQFLRVVLSDEQVRSADFYSIVPLVAEAMSDRLMEPIRPSIMFWKLKEPRPHTSLLPVNVILQDIAEAIHPLAKFGPYLVHDAEPLIELVVQQLPPLEVLEEVPDDPIDFVAGPTLDAPSVMAESTHFRNSRNKIEPFFTDHRHLVDTKLPTWVEDLPAISLQYKGFGYFLDVFQGRKDVPGLDRVKISDMRLAVDDLAERMSMIHKRELTRVHSATPALDDIFSARTDHLSLRLSSGNIGLTAKADAYIRGAHKVTISVMEFKNEPTGSAVPYLEAMGYFMHSVQYALKSAELQPVVLRCWNLPRLGVTIVGHYITFYAMIHFKQFRMVALTPPLSCIQDAGDSESRNALYNCFAAASVLLACIEEEARQLVRTPRPPITGPRHLPYVSTLRHPSGSSIDFKFCEKLPSKTLDQHVYVAQRIDGTPIIVKFTRRYSYELHTFCTNCGIAPKLLGFERLPGGFFGVAMEDFRSAQQIMDRLSDLDILFVWTAQLRKLVTAFHSRGFVHGDLRSANIVCDGNKVMLINFDRAGREGEVYYPDGSLNDELANGRDDTLGQKITKDDDLRILCNTLKHIRDRLDNA